MRGVARAAILAAAGAFTLSACGGAQAPTAGVAPAPLARSANPFLDLIHNSRDLGLLAAGKRVSLLLLLRDPTAARRAADLAAIYRPGSPTFGHFLTPRDLQRYGPRPAAVERARTYLRTAGIKTQWQRGNAWMVATGPAGAVDRIFHVDVHQYISPAGSRFYASAPDPAVPVALKPIVQMAGRVSSYRPTFHLSTRAVPSPGLTPTGLLTAYDLKPLRDMGIDGTGQTVAFIEIDGFKQQDFDQFTSNYFLPSMKPEVKFGGQDTNVQGEAEMDMEVVHEIAPGARLVVYNCGGCNLAQTAAARDRMAKENPGAIISDSIGLCEGNAGFAQTDADRIAYDDADSLGESGFAASGDSGAFDCLDFTSTPSASFVAADEPPSVPGVTSVGGTRLSVNKDGTWYAEHVWENPAETGGSGGAPSQFFSKPSWQQAPGVTGDKREQPDVAADADPISSPTVNINGTFTQVGGTSQAAPIWAGMTALIDQYLQKRGLRRAGFLNPALYSLASNAQPYPPFHDITQGTNLFYSASPGYDLATGLGTPDGWNLARDLEQYIKGGGK